MYSSRSYPNMDGFEQWLLNYRYNCIFITLYVSVRIKIKGKKIYIHISYAGCMKPPELAFLLENYMKLVVHEKNLEKIDWWYFICRNKQQIGVTVIKFDILKWEHMSCKKKHFYHKKEWLCCEKCTYNTVRYCMVNAVSKHCRSRFVMATVRRRLYAYGFQDAGNRCKNDGRVMDISCCLSSILMPLQYHHVQCFLTSKFAIS